MRVYEFLRDAKDKHDPIKILYPVDQLELLPADRKRKTYAVDSRSFVEDGFWQVYPIGIDRYHVYIVCPWCKSIHIHGNDNGHYAGHRVEHCGDRYKEHRNGYVILDAPNLKKPPCATPSTI